MPVVLHGRTARRLSPHVCTCRDGQWAAAAHVPRWRPPSIQPDTPALPPARHAILLLHWLDLVLWTPDPASRDRIQPPPMALQLLHGSRMRRAAGTAAGPVDGLGEPVMSLVTDFFLFFFIWLIETGNKIVLKKIIYHNLSSEAVAKTASVNQFCVHQLKIM